MVTQYQPTLAGKIIGMILELDHDEIIPLGEDEGGVTTKSEKQWTSSLPVPRHPIWKLVKLAVVFSASRRLQGCKRSPVLLVHRLLLLFDLAILLRLKHHGGTPTVRRTQEGMRRPS